MRCSGLGRVAMVFLGVFSFLAAGGAATWAEVGVTDNSILIGSIQDTTGAVAAFGISRLEAIKALLNYVNEQGGVNGRKILYVSESDNYEPPKTVLAFKKLTEVDKVFCIVGPLGVPNIMAMIPLAQERKIPTLFIGGNTSKLYNPPQRYIFGLWPAYEDFAKVLADYLAQDLSMPNAKVAHIHQDSDSGRDSLKGFKEQMAKHYPEMKLVASEGFKYGTVDFSANVYRMREANPDVVVFSTIFTYSAQIAREMEKVGWRPILLMDATSGDDRFITLGGSAVQGVVAQKTLPLMTEEVPGIKFYKELINRYFPESKINPSQFGATGFVEMQLALEAIKRVGKELTREGLVQTLESFRDVDIGSVPPISYGPQKRWGLNQVILVKVQGKEFVKVTGWRGPR